MKAGGGSTITQQLVRNTFNKIRKQGDYNDKSKSKYERKLDEILASLDLELVFSKNEILEKYLNAVSFGPVYGIEAASL